MKRMLSLRKVVVIVIFMLSVLGFSKAKVTIDGNINVRIGNNSKNSNYGNHKKSSIGNIDDSGYLYRPFVINNKMYTVVKDNYNNKIIIQTVFLNNNPRNGIYVENAFLLKRFTINCLAIEGDDDYCFTITSSGIPALYNRAEAQYVYYGYFIRKNNNTYQPGTFEYYSKEFYDEDFY